VGRSAPRLYHRQAEADLRVSSPLVALEESGAELGASAVTGPSCRAVDATPGPDKSMVRTVRGASGLETYVGMVIGMGSHKAPGLEDSDLAFGRRASAGKSLRLRKIVDSALPWLISR